MTTSTIRAGFYGKLPVRGDFVRSGLSREFVLAWDEWLQDVLPDCKAALGEGFERLWAAAPVWRFRLAPGLCGPLGAGGVWLASRDRVGRAFPLVLASEPDTGMDGFFDAAERCGRAAMAGAMTPEELGARLLDALPAGLSEPVFGASWWTGDGARVLGASLPGPRDFASMLAP